MTNALRPMSLDDLRRILVDCAGGDDSVEGDIMDVRFEDLGYDSLALIETGARLQRDYGLTLVDEKLLAAQTPAELLLLINDAISAST